MGAIVGLDCKIYLNTGASYAAPTWTECKFVQDATMNLSWEEADTSTRGSSFRSAKASIGVLEVTGTALRDKADTAFTAFDAAARGKTVIDILVLDGPYNLDGSEGYRFDGQIFNWSRNEALADAVAHDFTIKPVQSANAVTFFEGETP